MDGRTVLGFDGCHEILLRSKQSLLIDLASIMFSVPLVFVSVRSLHSISPSLHHFIFILQRQKIGIASYVSGITFVFARLFHGWLLLYTAQDFQSMVAECVYLWSPKVGSFGSSHEQMERLKSLSFGGS